MEEEFFVLIPKDTAQLNSSSLASICKEQLEVTLLRYRKLNLCLQRHRSPIMLSLASAVEYLKVDPF